MAVKVLIVEDESVTRESLTEYLRGDGFEVTASRSGEEAISVTLRDPPDIILMDLGLPGMSGIEAAQVIKRNSRFSKIPIIALSGRPSELWKATALSAGISLYITKPASLSEITAAIAQLLIDAGSS
jgi:DNA-binding response OmpR family regulator